MPMNPPPPDLVRRKGPPPPPPPMRQIGVSGWVRNSIQLFFAASLVVAAIVALSLGMQQQQEDVSKWAKKFDYDHCWGKFDTPACHERKAKENAKAYSEYEGKQ